MRYLFGLVGVFLFSLSAFTQDLPARASLFEGVTLDNFPPNSKFEFSKPLVIGRSGCSSLDIHMLSRNATSSIQAEGALTEHQVGRPMRCKTCLAKNNQQAEILELKEAHSTRFVEYHRKVHEAPKNEYDSLGFKPIFTSGEIKIPLKGRNGTELMFSCEFLKDKGEIDIFSVADFIASLKSEGITITAGKLQEAMLIEKKSSIKSSGGVR